MTDDNERQALPPRDGVEREAPFVMRSEGAPGDGKTLDGYAAVFNRETVIDSWEGRFREKIALGSMKRSFKETPPKIQYNHGKHPFYGTMPIAYPVDGYPREDSHPTLAPEGGAHIIARMHEAWFFEPIREVISTGTVDGMSFRFSVLQEDWHDADGKKVADEAALRDMLRRSWMEDWSTDELLLRTLRQLKVPELGPVDFPAYAETSVGMRSRTVVIDLARLNEPEQRSMLARAVFMADRAETPEPEAQPVTDEADERAEDSNDTQHATVPEAAGQHESDSTEARRRRDRLRRQASDHASYLLNIPERTDI